MNTEGFPKVENTNQSPNIIFDGNDRETDVFNYRLDLRLEDCRERMEEISSATDDFENNQEYLSLKYFLHIANAIRFKKGADYNEIYLSLKRQGGEIKDQIFEKVWLMLEDYVTGGWKRNKGFFSFLKRENNDSLIIEQVDVSYDREGQLIWAKIYKDKTKKLFGTRLEWLHLRKIVKENQ